jgi:hypothetical protein
MRSRACLTAAALALIFVACGGGGGGTPSPSPSPSPGTQNPCVNALEAGLDAALEAPRLPDGPPKDPAPIDDSTRWRVLEDLWTNRAAAARVAPQALTAPTRSADIGDIAVLHDQGDLILPANAFDLQGAGLRFSRNDAGGYDVGRVEATFRGTLGTRLPLGDDDSREANVPFTFAFYGRGHAGAFVNSDGNITFDEEDRASTERSVSRLLTGPPRVAPLLSDLDPSAGGSVWLHAAADQFTVTWCNVPEWDSPRRATVQVSLLPDGAVEVKIDGATTVLDAVVGLSPGRTGEFRPVDLSAPGPTPGGSAAVGERFSERGQLDTVSVARRFYQTHADAYDQLVMWTDTRVLTTAFAYESTVANEIRGIGQDLYDISREWGSGGRLRSVVVMDALTKYPDDPRARVLRQETTLSLLGHETGHRWLALIEFRDHEGRRSTKLLGRDEVHWSFFFDSDASFMEGNDIEDRGGGSFRTQAVVSRYNLLDQYAMGLVHEHEVPPFFYVDAPTNTTRQPSDPPALNVEFNGTRRDVLIQDVVAIHGPRVPSADGSPRLHRQAFIYITRAASPDPAQVAKLDRIRREWEPFFFQATDNRMQVETRLAP